MTQPLTIGLGTGRCGTKSLAALLNLPHEGHRGVIDWGGPTGRQLQRGLGYLRNSGGDVSHGWLWAVEYVWDPQLAATL